MRRQFGRSGISRVPAGPGKIRDRMAVRRSGRRGRRLAGADRGGGGLGMIDIARKSGGKLEYGFVPFDKDNAFFSLNVNVTT
mgnify:CR=1 FL=1